MAERINTDLQKILGEAVELDPPKSRIEKILYKILGYEIELDEPKSRTEKLLMQLAENPPGPEPGDDTLGEMLAGTLGDYENNTLTEIRDNAFYYNESKGKLSFPNVTKMCSHAFESSQFSAIELPKLEEIEGTNVFTRAQIENIFWPNLRIVPNNNSTYFGSCKKMKTMIIGSISHVAIPLGYAWASGCDLLEIVDLYATKLASYAFRNCYQLNKLILRGDSVASLDNLNALENTPIADGTGYIYVPDSLVDSYKAATNWAVFADQIKSIGDME